MNAQTRRETVAGPAGALECAVDEPVQASRGMLLVCHPHPQHGGTLDNKVAQTLARAGVEAGLRSVRFNFRGVGASAGAWDEGRGEIDDAMAALEAYRRPGDWLAVSGFSFGGYVAAEVAHRLESTRPADRLVLVGPSTERQRLPDVAADTAVIHGELDDIVPLRATFDWARPMSLPVTVIPGAGHFFHGQLVLLRRLVLQALR